MNQDTFNLNNKVYSNNNNLLFGIINDLQQVINNTNDNLIIKRIADIITKMNFIINENRKNTQLIMNQFALLHNQNSQMQIQLDQMNKNIANLNINNINNQEIRYNDGSRYVGQVVNGLKEGKGIMNLNNGDRYEGEWRNDKREGKGIKYFNEEPFKGDRYEGDYRNDKREGKGIYYWNNGNRAMGDYYNGEPIGKHVKLTKNGEVKTYNY